MGLLWRKGDWLLAIGESFHILSLLHLVSVLFVFLVLIEGALGSEASAAVAKVLAVYLVSLPPMSLLPHVVPVAEHGRVLIASSAWRRRLAIVLL